MTYSVKLSPHAAKQYRRIDGPIKSRLHAAFDTLQTSPASGPNVKPLKGQLRRYFRYRVGDYRIIYTIAMPERIVYVDYIQHRKDVYRP